MSDKLSGPALDEHLARWVEEGLIDSDQAARMEAAAVARLPGRAVSEQRVSPASGSPVTTLARSGRLAGRTPLVVEALGYLGGALAIIAGFIAVNQLWPDIPVAAQLTFAGTAAVVLGVVGGAIRTGGDPAFGRLRSVLWLMSTTCLAAFVNLLAAGVWSFSQAGATVLAAAVTTAYAAVMWWRRPTPVQHLAMFVAAAVTVGSGIAWVDTDHAEWAPGLGVWALSALWAIAVHRGHLRPRLTGYVAAAVGLLVGAQLTMAVAAGHVLALCTVAALLAAGVVLRRVWLLALGAVGVMMVVPETAVRYLPESVGAPLALLAVGLVLLGAAIWLARTWRRPRPANADSGRQDRRPPT
jgi:hypothetical protein